MRGHRVVPLRAMTTRCGLRVPLTPERMLAATAHTGPGRVTEQPRDSHAAIRGANHDEQIFRAGWGSAEASQPWIWDKVTSEDVDLDARLTRLLRTYYGVGWVPEDCTEFFLP
jgi:hypothetical protein